MKYYDRAGHRVVCVGENASNQFWDEHWTAKADGEVLKLGRPSRLVVQTTRRYLPPGARVLEGGCGLGQNVLGLAQEGFDAIGLDYADDTVKRIKKYYPQLDVRLGDVRSVPFPDAHFDGYWSLGVIEHFYEGFEAIASEMHRVLKPGGYLFLTFPYLSPLRRIKAAMGGFEAWKENPELRSAFYQFLLDPRAVANHFRQLGFTTAAEAPYDALKGLKDELFPRSRLLQAVYDGAHPLHRGLRLSLNLLLGGLSSHAVLLVLRKQTPSTH